MADLEHHLGEASAITPVVLPKLTDTTLEHLEQTIKTAIHLEGAADALVGTERFLYL